MAAGHPGSRRVRYYATRFRSFEGGYLLVSTDADRQTMTNTLNSLSESAAASLAKFQPLASEGTEHELAQQITSKWAAYQPLLDKEMEINRTSARRPLPPTTLAR